VAFVDLLHGPADHLDVHGFVVDRLRNRELAGERDQAEEARAADEEPRCPTPPMLRFRCGRFATCN
jgi:hypothetical protein